MDFMKMKDRFADRFEETGMPEQLTNVPPEQITDLDVRDDLRTGREPFTRIINAQASLPADHVLRLRAIFEPVPLYTALRKFGFAHWTEKIADDDWRVWFYRTSAVAGTPPAPQQPPAGITPGDANVELLDVRGLEPPEPMQRTLERLAQLPPEKSLLQINNRVPQFLLPMLAERGFEYVVVFEAPGEVRGLIRRITQKEKS